MRQCPKDIKGLYQKIPLLEGCKKGAVDPAGQECAVSGEGAGAITSIPWLDYRAVGWLALPLAVAPTIKAPAGMERSGIPAR